MDGRAPRTTPRRRCSACTSNWTESCSRSDLSLTGRLQSARLTFPLQRCATIQRMPRVRGIALLVAALVVCTATIARAQNAPTQSAPAEAEAARAFRLGTAARPFAWATAIGDLNADGRP